MKCVPPRYNRRMPGGMRIGVSRIACAKSSRQA
jgi:hypothetical protein